ncbi:hypothetical protein KC959_02455 [Candidatus Saccharibacteria bacterium]|nr:hypothetical protein [Candidatus Saccharibacteria bacterium]
MQENAIALPVSIVSPTDIARLTREIEAIDNFFREQVIRSGGASANTMPRLSKLMDQLAADNQLNLLNEPDRAKVFELLERLHAAAPVMHISFSVDPPGAYVQNIVEWLRRNIHQHTLVTVGLQPNIGAGCVVRTTNKLFDFSLREYFSQKRDFFIEKLHVAISDEAQAPTEDTASETPEQSPVPQVAATPVEQPRSAAQQPVLAQETVTPPIPAPAPLPVEENGGSA